MHIRNWNDFKVFGINALTGEACRYSQRTLCDLNEDGVTLVTDLFGLQITANPQDIFSANWNSMVGDKPSVASIMLHRGMFDAICEFALFHTYRCKYAIKQVDGTWVGYDDADIEAYKITEQKLATIGGHLHRNPVRDQSGSSRNTHAFTGRST